MVCSVGVAETSWRARCFQASGMTQGLALRREKDAPSLLACAKMSHGNTCTQRWGDSQPHGMAGAKDEPGPTKEGPKSQERPEKIRKKEGRP